MLRDVTHYNKPYPHFLACVGSIVKILYRVIVPLQITVGGLLVTKLLRNI